MVELTEDEIPAWSEWELKVIKETVIEGKTLHGHLNGGFSIQDMARALSTIKARDERIGELEEAYQYVDIEIVKASGLDEAVRILLGERDRAYTKLAARDERIGELEDTIKCNEEDTDITMGELLELKDHLHTKLTAAEDEVKRLREALELVVLRRSCRCAIVLEDCAICRAKLALASSSGEGEQS
jgi:hypothetical protein